MSVENLGERPTPRPRADLKSAFAPPDRTSRLGGRLAKPPRPTSLAPAAEATAGESTPAREIEQPPAPAAQRPESGPALAQEAAPPTRKSAATGAGDRRGRKTARRAKRQVAEGGTATTIVYLPGEVLELLRQQRLRTGSTYTDLVLDALDATHLRLGELLEATEQPQTRPAGSLFAGTGRSRSATAQPKAQITLRPRTSDAEVIDGLARDLGTNRSKLVEVALTAHLTA